MALDRNEIAAILHDIAELLVILDSDPSRSRDYRRAARRMERIDADLAPVLAEGRLRRQPGIGAEMEREIAAMYRSGRSGRLEDLHRRLPEGMDELRRVPGLGPARIRTLHTRLGITTLEGLDAACRGDRLVDLPGFDAVTRDRILAGVLQIRRYRGKILLPDGERLAGSILDVARGVAGVRAAAPVGAMRRREAVLREVEILIGVDRASNRSELRRELAKRLSGLDGVHRVEPGADGGIALTLERGVGGRLHIATTDEYPWQLLCCTGTERHLAALRHRAAERGLRFPAADAAIGAGGAATEAEIYARLGLPFIPPELRRDGRDLEFVQSGGLSGLLRREDLRGTLHVHTTWSDGAASIEAMAVAAARLGFEYLGIADHSRSSRIANGLSIERLRKQIEAIEEWNRRSGTPRLLKGCEVDILADGRLDYPDEVLARLDFVIGSVHSKLGMGREAMTGRMIRAMDNPHLTILGHPTERLLLTREPVEIDLYQITRAAARRGVILELNANPRRLDVDADVARYAAGLGVLLCINPDAHTPDTLADVDYGVTEARKAWLRPENVFNCRPFEAVVDHGAARRRP